MRYAKLLSGFVFVLLGLNAAALSGAQLSEPIISLICGLFNAFKVAAGAVASLVLIYAALKYISSVDDPGARKLAKEIIKYTLIGLIIVMLSEVLVIHVGPPGSKECSVWCATLNC